MDDLDPPPESPAMELYYMQLLRKSMHYLGSWPYSTFGQNRAALPMRHPVFLLALWSTNVFLQALYIRNHLHQTLYDLGLSYVTTFMTLVVAQRLALTFFESYKQVIKKFVNEIHLINYKADSEYAIEIKDQVHKISAGFCYIIHMCVFGAWLFTNATPIFFNYHHGMFSDHPPENGTYQLIGYYALPFDYTNNMRGYLFIAFCNLFLSFDCGSGFGIPDLFISIVIFHVWGHMKILKYNLNNFPRPKMIGQITSYENPDWFTPEETKLVVRHLKKNIDHHRQLMYFMSETSDAFGLSLALYFAFHQTCLCILLLLCSELDPAALGEYGLLTVVLTQQLMQVSIIFELISSKSEELPGAVYSVPWECMRTRERKSVFIFLINAQETIALKAMGIVPIGVQTMASILRTSISYFLMLRTFAE